MHNGQKLGHDATIRMSPFIYPHSVRISDIPNDAANGLSYVHAERIITWIDKITIIESPTPRKWWI